METQTYYQKNREVLLERAKQRYHADPDKRRAYSRAYYQENKEKMLAYGEEYRRKNPLPKKERSKGDSSPANSYYQLNREKLLAKAKERYRQNGGKARDYAREYGRKYYQENKEEMREYSREYREATAEQRKEYYAKWYAAGGKARIQARREAGVEWGKKFPEKKRIEGQTRNALKHGKIIRPETCSRCEKKSKVHAHHYNYDHFMNFVWLCPTCHKRAHCDN